MVAESARSASCDGCTAGSTTSSQPSCSGCRLLVESLNRQSAAMERLADLLPQLIAQNQVFIRLLLDREDRDEPESYLDGTPR